MSTHTQNQELQYIIIYQTNKTNPNEVQVVQLKGR